MYLLPKEHHHGQVIKMIKTLLLIVENIFWCWGVSKSFSVNQETQQIRLLPHNNTVTMSVMMKILSDYDHALLAPSGALVVIMV